MPVCVFSGFYCNQSAFLHSPTDGTTGNICPTGYYCPTGNTAAIACPMGYYLDVIMSSALSNCKICTAGRFDVNN